MRMGEGMDWMERGNSCVRSKASGRAGKGKLEGW